MADDPAAPAQHAPVGFDAIYRAEFAFVWRTLLRLGVERSSVDDACQEVFLVIHRKLGEFEGRSQLRTWVYGVVRRVASDHRRTRRRKPADPRPADTFEALRHPGADAATERLEAADLVGRLLERLDDEKREVLVLSDLEELTLAQIAELTGVNANTLSARLRAARRQLVEALEGQGLARPASAEVRG